MKTFLFIFCLLISTLSLASDNLEKAVAAYQANDVDTAYIYLKNALQEDEDNLPAKVLMGHVLVAKGLYRDGIQEFNDALLMGADANQFIYEQVRAMMLIGRYQDIIDLLKHRALNEKVEVKTLLVKSNALMAMDKTEQALEPLVRAKNLAPKDASVLSSLANYYITIRQFKIAENYIKNLIEFTPQNSKVWNLYADFYTAQGMEKDALEALTKAHDFDPDDPVIMRALAHQYTNFREHEKALELVNTIIERTPNDPYARLLKSQLLTQNNQLDEAQQILEDISAKLSLLTDAQKNSNASLAYVAGAAAFMQGNLELAQKELVTYVNSNPNDLSGLNMLTEIYLQQGQPDKVQQLLERNEKIVLRDLSLSLKLFNVYLQTNKTYKAKNILADLSKTFTNNSQIIIAQANYLAKSRRYKEALALLDSHQPEPVTATFALNKGLIYMEQGDYNQARNIAKDLLKLAPNNTSFINFKGVILLRSGQYLEAANEFNRVLTITPDNYTSSFNLANAYAKNREFTKALSIVNKLHSNGSTQQPLLMLKAKLERDTRQADKARETVTAVLDKDAFHVGAIELLMGLEYQTGNYQKALDLVNKLENQVFLEPKHLIYKANIFIKQKRYKEAKQTLGVLQGLAENGGEFYQLSLLQNKAFDLEGAYKSIEQAIIKQPNIAIYHFTKAQFSLALNPIKESKSQISALNKKYPENANVALLQGDLAQKEQKLNDAFNHYWTALKRDNNFNDAVTRLYVLANQQVKPKAFEKRLEDLLTKNANNVYMRNLLADYYLNTNQPEKARKHYELIDKNQTSNYANILNNLANIYLSSDLSKARELVEQAVTLSPNNSSYMDTQGWVLSLQGEHVEALKKLRNAYALNSSNPSIPYHLGFTLHKLGRDIEAKIELEKALASDTQFSGREDAEQLLNELNKQS